jgi:hypothetical protein
MTGTAQPSHCPQGLPRHGTRPKLCGMFIVDEEAAAAIRRAWTEGGELSAVVELRRRFLGITDAADARSCVRAIVGWTQRPDGQ